MSRGLVPRNDDEGSLGRADKRWAEGHVVDLEVATLTVGGTPFSPAGLPVPSTNDMGATVEVDFSEDHNKSTPTADTTYTFSNAADGTTHKLLIQGDSNEYTIAFPGAVIWTGEYPTQLADGHNFLFEFSVFDSVVYGTFHGTWKTEVFPIYANGVNLTATSSVDSTVVNQKCQVWGVHFMVDLSSEIDLEFDLKVNTVSLFTTTPKINTGHLSSAESGVGVIDRTKRVLSVGDLLETDVVAIGSPTVGQGLKMALNYLVLP